MCGTEIFSYGFPVLNLFDLIAIALDTVCPCTVEVPIILEWWCQSAWYIILLNTKRVSLMMTWLSCLKLWCKQFHVNNFIAVIYMPSVTSFLKLLPAIISCYKT